MPEPVVRLLLTRGTQWKRLMDWRILEMASEPHLLTCQKRGTLSACLTSTEAAGVVARRYPEAELYMWDNPDWIPGRSLQGFKAAVYVVPAASRRIPA